MHLSFLPRLARWFADPCSPCTCIYTRDVNKKTVQQIISLSLAFICFIFELVLQASNLLQFISQDGVDEAPV